MFKSLNKAVNALFIKKTNSSKLVLEIKKKTTCCTQSTII